VTYVLGVDAGNTKTIAFVGHRDGRIAGFGRAGCGDIYGATSPEAAFAAVETAVGDALRMAGAGNDELLAGVFSIAGADWPEDFDFIHAAMARRRFGEEIIIHNDAIGALRAGSPDGTGVVIACGTGVAIGARAADGRLWHTSHWQEPHGSHQLSFKMLRAVYRSELGIDPPTSMTARVLAFLDAPTVEAVLHHFTERVGEHRADWGGLARLLLDEAGAGDPAARAIVTEHGAALGDYALAAARKVGIERTAFTLVLTGGVLRHSSPLLSQTIIARVRAVSPAVRPVNSRFEPAVGAFFLALEAAGVVIDEPLIERTLPTVPSPTFFKT
jgi:N-acetylglucosamine kinase-like BadF-type ATPase